MTCGVEPKEVDPRAVRAMAEAGVDISGQASKDVSSLAQDFEYVITLCDHAHETCPFFPAFTRVLHAGFEDPRKPASGARTEEEAMDHYRRVHDEIREFVRDLPRRLGMDATAE